MEIWMLILAVFAGYVASAYTWPKIKVFFNGAATEAQKLRAKAAALEAAIKS